MAKLFNKILIANRGEIAVRVIRACRRLGITSAAVYSDADRTAMHVRMADEAYYIGESPSTKSYLQGEKILATANKAGAQAIHPGYGFLAENWQFAKMVEESGLIFIGPSAKSIHLLGDKLMARELAIEAGIPVIPGGAVDPSDMKSAQAVAEKCEYPVLVKAVAGGGGKGMRVVERPENLEFSLAAAGSEARSAFGDDRVYIEKLIHNPRHIEMQIARDRSGYCVYLGERECSIQRRHQKLIEEAPSVFVDDRLRATMGAVAVKVATAADYVNLGTVEFLVDESRDFYFLEVNTRLQVEHPATELVTGIDLVKEQISVAAGNRLSFSQEQVRLRGHAIECRICAEDPENDFLPSSGELFSYREPAGPGVRVDSGVRTGSQVPPYYDPLIAKLICYGSTRDEAIERMTTALKEYCICGIASNIPFHESVMAHSAFREGKLSTEFIPMYFPDGFQSRPPDEEMAAAAAVAAAIYHFYDMRRLKHCPPAKLQANRWNDQGRASSTHKLPGGRW